MKLIGYEPLIFDEDESELPSKATSWFSKAAWIILGLILVVGGILCLILLNVYQ
jgi:hypothetical protein